MILKLLKPKKALNKAYLKVKPHRNEIEQFKSHLLTLLNRINEAETEEFHKNLVIDFLKKTYYDPNYFINTKGKNDLVIHNGKSAKSTVGVIIEAKSPTNKYEMINTENINRKAFQELVLYYLRERITHKNLEIKHLVATNINEWFIFNATTFDRLFAQNKSLVKQFRDFEENRLAETKTDFFYNEIASPFIEQIKTEIEFTYFNFQDYQKPLRNDNKRDDNKLIALFKLLSPEHLLKLPFANDSNSLDKRFYSELLHIIGLSETKEGSKKLIERSAKNNRNTGSILESTIIQLESLDIVSRLKNANQFGSNTKERTFNVALELVITWINRVLFLKLMEAQLIKYNYGNPDFAFLNFKKLQNYDDLNSLFFQVLARETKDRNDDVKKDFANVPYLNSSLFEPTEIERDTLYISNLRDDKTIPIFAQTVLKDSNGKRRKGELTTLQYLFQFLNAYDFSSEGSEEIQEDNKTLINASVLGLIFEKINGYKDGSFFTPGFITMYMARETIRKTVIQKFNEIKDWNCTTIPELYNKIDNINEANEIINSIKLLDPAVGSGHFLVSSLNEMIAVKNDLKILQDKNGLRLKEYQVEVVNDELIVTDEDGELFEYHPTNKESQRIQETLFREKQTIIENCLFGVDINSNSVKICRLRLWIELLKNAYYKNETELETLPNIDINIKNGNSLISRFDLDSDLKKALKNSKWNIDSYRLAVASYRNAKNKDHKREMEQLIDEIKLDFRSEISLNDPKVKRLRKLSGELFMLTQQKSLFEMTKREKTAWNKKVKDLTKKTKKLETEIEEIKSNKIYENAFEWRFEFPEVLNDVGDFVGFDAVIANPPYIRQEEIKEFKPYLKDNYTLYSGTADLYIYFIELAFKAIKPNGLFTFIMPNKFMQAGYGQPVRKFFLNQQLHQIIDFGDFQVFDEATTYPCILLVTKTVPQKDISIIKISDNSFRTNFREYISTKTHFIEHQSLSEETWIISNPIEQNILKKAFKKGQKLGNFLTKESKRGILTGLTKAFVIDEEKADELINSNAKNKELIVPFLSGRETKPYFAKKPSKYLIKIEKGFTNSNGENQPEKWFEREYPEVYKHLKEFEVQAKKRSDKGDYYWELRACDYYDEFESPKIMYQVFQVKPCFILDENGYYCNNSMWILPTADKVLLGILNSKMGWWLISKYCTAIQNGYQLIWKYFSEIPIIQGNEEQRIRIENIVNEILSQKKENPETDTSELEAKIDNLVYELYELTEEEIAVIENSL